MNTDLLAYKKRRAFLRFAGIVGAGVLLAPTAATLVFVISSAAGEFSALFMASYLMDRTLASVLGVGVMVFSMVAQSYLIYLFAKGWYELYGESILTI